MEKLIEATERYENQALELGDLRTAMNLNWLKNSMRHGNIDSDEAFFRLLSITVSGR